MRGKPVRRKLKKYGKKERREEGKSGRKDEEK